MKFSNLYCSNCGKKNDEKTFFVAFAAGWYFESEFKIKYSTKPVLCPECFRPILEIVKKKLLENAAREVKRGKQLNFDSELDSAKSNPEPEQPAASTAISGGLGLGENPAIDCIHYIATYTCIARGDAFGCEDCEDYKSIIGDEPDDE